MNTFHKVHICKSENIWENEDCFDKEKKCVNCKCVLCSEWKLQESVQ